MPNSSLSYPKVRIDKSGKYFIDLTLNDKRYRLYSGKIIKSSLRPNSYPAKYRLSKAKILADEVYKHLVSNDYCFDKKLTKVETFDSLVNNKLSEPLSNSYRKTLRLLSKRLRSEPNINIFSGKETPYNNDYFKTLFRRFKGLNNHIDNGVTLYSFRHSGAIEIYKRTGSLSKLQTAMGHSSLNVSLTYLRGLEIAELKEEDMPMV